MYIMYILLICKKAMSAQNLYKTVYALTGTYILKGVSIYIPGFNHIKVQV